MLRHSRGFSVIELMVTITLLALLLGVALPSFRTWIRNAQVRTVSDGLQTGLRTAQAEAIRRHRQVVFYLSNDSTCTAATAATSNGAFWVVRTVPLMSGEAAEALQCGHLGDVASGVAIAADATALCFNSGGRQVANADPGLGGGIACVLDNTGTSRFNLSSSGADRPLRVLVTLGGSVRLCDPAKTLSASTPDGCPA
ncbi:MAG TPA: GspH/FimT family pseudopilin [Rubrivivax sp.]|nr:GspH/FimT family pseudopilin [Rubrivivax sp.]